MSYLRAIDTISGAEGAATLTLNNTVTNLFYIKNLEATMDINKTEVKTLGKRGTQHKPNGWSGSGSMTIYYITSFFRNMVQTYATNGTLANFDITVTNNDPASSAGAQVVKLKNCSLDSIVLAKLDVDAEVLDEDVEFTFDGFEVTTLFAQPTFGN